MSLPDPATRPEWANLFHHATADVEVEIFEGKGGARGVKPGQFIAWARSKGCGPDTKFDVLLANSKPAAKVEAGAGTTPGDDWTEEARAIADECFDHDTKMNCRDSLKGYSSRVMDIMQKRGIKGARGIIDNQNTIMREALQGKKWWANKSK